MADRNKFEEMLDLLVNEDKEGAEALFHEIVVEKSRDIYESLLEDDAEIEEESDEEVDEATDEEVDESDEDLDESEDEDDDDDEEMEEGFDLDEFEVEADDDMGGDPMDDMMGDIEGGDDEEGEEDEGDMEDRVEDLEDALEDLKAEFEKMMAGDEGDEEADDMDDMDDGEEAEEESLYFGEADEEVEEDEDLDEGANKSSMMKDAETMSKAEFIKKHGKENADTWSNMNEASKGPKSDIDMMREYVEKVSGGGLDAQGSAPMGDNGANTKSPVAGKNDMGGTASNLTQGKDNEAGDHAGLGDMNAKEDNAGNVNVPGGKASKSNKAMPKGHGAEKKGAGETADKGAGSPINGVKTRAK
jgi:hypothetical protein